MLGLDKMYIFIAINFYLFYPYHYYYCYYLLLLLLLLLLLILSSLLYITVLKSSNSSSNRETYYTGYYVDKDTHKKTVISLFFDVVIRLEFNVDVISEKLEWSPVPHLRKLLRFT